MKRKIKLTENNLKRIIRNTLNENERVYGSQNIRPLYDKLNQDEYVDLNDDSGELSGQIVSIKDYVIKSLKEAIRKEDWSMVQNVISFLKIKNNL